MSPSHSGQIISIHDLEDDTIYEKAVKALVKNFNDPGPLFILTLSNISNFFRQPDIEGRKITFINERNEADEVTKNSNLIRVFEIEYPITNGDQLQLQINHMVIYKIDLSAGEEEWPINLTEKEREHARNGIARSKMMYGASEAKTYNAIVNNAWTYVIFVFDPTDKEFKLTKIETKTK